MDIVNIGNMALDYIYNNNDLLLYSSLTIFLGLWYDPVDKFGESFFKVDFKGDIVINLLLFFIGWIPHGLPEYAYRYTILIISCIIFFISACHIMTGRFYRDFERLILNEQSNAMRTIVEITALIVSFPILNIFFAFVTQMRTILNFIFNGFRK